MRAIIFFSILAGSSPASAFVPVHGCEWVPEITAITNFTFFDGTSSSSTPDYVTWQAPAIGVSCYASSSASAGNATPIGGAGTSTTVRCQGPASDPTTGTFLESTDNGSGINATLTFYVYEQCAASVFAFHYMANFLLSCAKDEGVSATCISKNNATAIVTATAWIPYVGGPPHM